MNEEQLEAIEKFAFDTKGTVTLTLSYHVGWSATYASKRGENLVSTVDREGDGQASPGLAIANLHRQLKEKGHLA